MKRILVITVWMIAGAIASSSAQSLHSEVIGTAGDHIANGNSQLQWTAGETIVETHSANDLMLTQGFHQPQLTITGIDEADQMGLELRVYPNPTSEFLNIKVEGAHPGLIVTLYDGQSRLLLSTTLSKEQNTRNLQMTNFAKAVYFLEITDNQGTFHASHRVSKQ